MGHTPRDSVGGVLISLSMPWARRWINQWSPWRMASAMPDLRLPSQLQGITAVWRGLTGLCLGYCYCVSLYILFSINVSIRTLSRCGLSTSIKVLIDWLELGRVCVGLTGTKLYCLVTEARVCVNNLPKVVTWKWNVRESNPRPFVSPANAITITPPGLPTCRISESCLL